MGHVMNYTIGDVVTHFRRRTGTARPAPDGLRRVRPARRERTRSSGAHPREIDERIIESSGARSARGGAIDWSREFDPRAGLLPLDAVDLPAALRARARLPEGGARQVVPHDQTVLANEQVIDGRCERCGTEVEPRPWSSGSSGSPTTPTAARRSRRPSSGRGDSRRCSATGSGAPRAPRSTSGARNSGRLPSSRRARHAVRRDVHRARARAPAGRRLTAGRDERRSATTQRRARSDGGARRRRQGKDRRLHRPPRRQPGQRRAIPM